MCKQIRDIPLYILLSRIIIANVQTPLYLLNHPSDLLYLLRLKVTKHRGLALSTLLSFSFLPPQIIHFQKKIETMCKKDRPPPEIWNIVKSESVDKVGRFAYLDHKLASPIPGTFVMIRAKGATDRYESFTSIATVGEKAILFASAIRRLRPSLVTAMETHGEIEVIQHCHVRNCPYGYSHNLHESDTTTCFIVNSGNVPLTITPLASMLRWNVRPDALPPAIFWALHSQEEIEYLVNILSHTTFEKSNYNGRHATLIFYLCGDHERFEDHKAAIEKLRTLVPAEIGVKRMVEGIDAIPREVMDFVNERKLERVNVETMSQPELQQQIRERMEGFNCEERAVRLDFAKPTSFGWINLQKSGFVGFEPWPATSTLPPTTLLPFTFGRTKMPFQEWLFLETDPLPLALFRIAFGYLIFSYGWEAISTGRAYRDHEWSGMRFKYDFFEHLGPDLPPPYCYYVYYLMSAAGFGMMIGYPYRLSSVLFTLTFAWHFFAEATHYNNHYYLMICLGVLFSLVDADATLKFSPLRCAKWLVSLPPRAVRWFSRKVEVGTGSGAVQRPVACEGTVRGISYINHYLLKSFVLFVFFYGAIAKLNNDWVSGHVMRAGMTGQDPPWVVQELCVFFLGWGGLVFDYVGPLYLCYNPLRVPALAGFVFFNVSNMLMFNIGCFPWMMLASIALLVETNTCRDKIRQLLMNCALISTDKLSWYPKLARIEAPLRKLTRYLGWTFYPTFTAYTDKVNQLYHHEVYTSMPNGVLRAPKPAPMPQYSTLYRWTITLMFWVVILLEFTVPLRNWAYHKNTDQVVSWTEHGRKFSWHMMSRHKHCGGNMTIVHNHSSMVRNISLYAEKYNGPIALNGHQLKKVCKT